MTKWRNFAKSGRTDCFTLSLTTTATIYEQHQKDCANNPFTLKVRPIGFGILRTRGHRKGCFDPTPKIEKRLWSAFSVSQLIICYSSVSVDDKIDPNSGLKLCFIAHNYLITWFDQKGSSIVLNAKRSEYSKLWQVHTNIVANVHQYKVHSNQSNECKVHNNIVTKVI